MIRDDTISKMLTFLAGAITLYLLTFEAGITIIGMPLVLLLLSGFFEWKFLRRTEDVDTVVGVGPEAESTRRRIAYWTALAVAGMAITGIAIKKADIPEQLAAFDIILFGILMAVSEERFFRKTVTTYFITRLGFTFGVFMAATFFTIYHLARYKLETLALRYVFMGGAILSWVAWRSKRLSPVMLAHIINNIVAVTII